jgi:MerR family transcriptional regulator, light-induced transcriptional regulator
MLVKGWSKVGRVFDMDREKEAAVLRIGELSRRVGVSEHVLRAWESRYGLLRPERSAGGFRLYSEDDQSRVRRMQVHLAGGLAAAQAAQAAIAEGQLGGIVAAAGDAVDAVPRADLVDSADALRQALDDLDEQGAQAVLDRLLTDFTVETVLRDVVMPYLHELGERWEQGVVSVAQEHFASYVVRGRLTGLARGWGNGRGPQALLACPPDEPHDLALLVFGIVLNRGGWRVEFLGANTPMLDTIQVTSQTQPSLVVLAAITPERFAAVRPELARLADMAPLVLAGAGATGELASSVGARLLTGDPVTAAEHLAGS